MEEMYSMDDLVQKTKLTEKQIKSEVKKGLLKAKIVGFKYIFTESNIQEWINTPSEPLTKAKPKSANAKPKGRPPAVAKPKDGRLFDDDKLTSRRASVEAKRTSRPPEEEPTEEEKRKWGTVHPRRFNVKPKEENK